MTQYKDGLWHFVGRGDVFARQSKEGAYFPERRAITQEDLDEHRAGFTSIGTYTLNPLEVRGEMRYYANFIVFDLDTFDEDQLRILKKSVERMIDPFETEFPMLMLEKSGGKGFHIWLFLEEPVEAYRLKHWLDDEFWPYYVSKGGDPKLEVFPKQTSVREGGYGNLTKLPLGVHAVTGNRSEIISGQGWVSEVSSIRGVSEALIPNDPDRMPAAQAVITAETPTGILLTDGPVARFLKGEVQQGERNLCFHAFFTWCAWNIHLPSDLAWQWWEQLNGELPDPEDDEASVTATMESAYLRPPADAADKRPPRRSPADRGRDPVQSVDERRAAMRAARGR